MRNVIRGLMAALLLAVLPLAANAGVFVSVTIAPPVLPVYELPPTPGPGYYWTPGYWAWADGGYYWVPGTWVLAPEPGLLWTPGYWGFAEGVYVWHVGYWGPHVGYYGGIDYGYGYSGVGFHGGYWRGGTFIVDRVVIERPPVNRVCFNGAGGVVAHESPDERRFEHERHIGLSEMQRHNEVEAGRDTTMRASYNHGRPPVAATAKPGVFYGHDVMAARAGGERPMAAEHGAAGAHQPVMARASGTEGGHVPNAPQAMNPPRAAYRPPLSQSPGMTEPHAANQPQQMSRAHGLGPPAAMTQSRVPSQSPAVSPPHAVSRPSYNAPAPRGAYPAPQGYAGGAAHGGGPGAPRAEPGNAHAAQQGHGGEREREPGRR
jgi:hypothetical protein